MADDTDDVLAEAKEAYQRALDNDNGNYAAAEDDIRFALLGEQWPDDVLETRKGRPSLTINKMPSFIRQVVNDARQNKPSIKVHPADSGADPETAEIYNGLIRNIEYSSNADVAYDTATECAVTGGFGYFRIGLDYAYDDTFDLELKIERIANQFSVHGDPMSTAADSSDWNVAFVVDTLSREEFEKQYKGADPVDWDAVGYDALESPWIDDETKRIAIAEYWTREDYDKPIVLLSDGTIVPRDRMMEPEFAAYMMAAGVTVQQERTARCKRVKQRILTGAEVIKSEDWLGQYIPIVPVYGQEINLKGVRTFKSLIRDSKDAQRMLNYWRSTSTELVALAPKAPFIGPEQAFKGLEDKWSQANVKNYAYLEYKGNVPPQRQPFQGPDAGVLQEALNASDDMKATMGLYDASLGARSNETSGKAIMARQREGDVSTFHFMDNMSRAIRHAGRILIDLIPHVYSKERIVRVMGEDGTPNRVQLGQAVPVTGKDGQPQMQPAIGPDGRPMVNPDGSPQMVPLTRIYDLGAGKYDLTVTTGPSYTTRREEAATQMTEMIRAFPAAAPVIGPRLARNLDWPEADEIADDLKALAPQPQGLPPEVQQLIQKGQQTIQQQAAEIEQLKSDRQIDLMKAQTDARKVDVDQYKAETDRIQALKPEPVQPAPVQ